MTPYFKIIEKPKYFWAVYSFNEDVIWTFIARVLDQCFSILRLESRRENNQVIAPVKNVMELLISHKGVVHKWRHGLSGERVGDFVTTVLRPD